MSNQHLIKNARNWKTVNLLNAPSVINLAAWSMIRILHLKLLVRGQGEKILNLRFMNRVLKLNYSGIRSVRNIVIFPDVQFVAF